MSMDGEVVVKKGRLRSYVPVVRKSNSTLFASLATMRRATGRPRRLA
ncbi:Uncharacterised protein [Collinsella intestinalis]|nr:Uncharacterised protein [Collinsella intestinalis]